jgi:carbon monoxide dehydrogenase subunit G
VEFEHEILIAAPPDAVWGRLMDLDRASEIMPVLQSVELLDGGVYPGARVRVTVSAMGTRRAAEGRLTIVEPARRLALEADLPEVKAKVTAGWTITPDAAGSRVVQYIALKFTSQLARMAAKAVLRDDKADVAARQGLQALKDAVETDAAGEPAAG